MAPIVYRLNGATFIGNFSTIPSFFKIEIFAICRYLLNIAGQSRMGQQNFIVVIYAKLGFSNKKFTDVSNTYVQILANWCSYVDIYNIGGILSSMAPANYASPLV